jgi:soluble lytic murein transglycosylase
MGRHRQALALLLLASAMMTPPAFGKNAPTSTHRQASGHHGAAADAKHEHGKGRKGERVEKAKTRTVPERESIQESAAAAQSSADLAAVKEALGLVRHHKFSEASALAGTLDDPGARKLVEWVILRDPNSPASFERYAAFLQTNPDWPGTNAMRRRSEARLWQERRDAATIRRFIGGQPSSAIGRLALARVLQGEGDRARVEREVKAVWASAEMSPDLEAAVASEFSSVLTSADDVARMDRRIGAKDFGAAMRAAKRLGPGRVAIVKACEAAESNSKKAKTLLGEVPDELRGDLGYVLCQLHWLQLHDDFAAAAKLLTETSLVGMERQDTDEWWRERRLLARKLLDLGDAQIAYRVVREAAVPANPYYRSEYHFMAGWIALRFLNDPATASSHFAHVDDGSNDPIVLARAAYWRGRAAEAMNQSGEMRAQYEAAAAFPTAYYGQLARARLGHSQIAVFAPAPATGGARADLVHAADILYALGEFDLVLSFVSDFAETTTDVATLNALGELTAHYHDAQAMLALGKTALARGLPLEQYAFPEIGVPAYKPIAPPIDHCVVYAIVRTESAFNQADTSPAKAVGLMQVTPEAGRDTAKRFGISYNWKKLVSDPVYNTQMGAAELSALYKEYAGSYVMTFAGYNAGRGRVRQWVAQHGDPRDPNVDEVDWVERIPISETRNYVQRVMENLQMYGVRLGATVGTLEPNLHRGANVPRPPKPFFVNAIPD